MKPEPLKGQMCCDMFVKEDIKSAVEWLKDKIDGITNLGGDTHCPDLMDLIDEAFEDVI